MPGPRPDSIPPDSSRTAPVVVVRYFAGAAAAAGCTEEKLTMPAGATLAMLVEDLAGRHGAALARVLPAASFLLDEVTGGLDRALHDGAVVDVLPPFAGG